MKNFFKIYVPSTINGTKKAIKLQKMVAKEVLKAMVNLFGGATQTPCIGAWKMESGAIVEEKVLTITSFCDDAKYNEHRQAMENIAKMVCDKMTQECVSLESQNGLEFVQANTMKIAA